MSRLTDTSFESAMEYLDAFDLIEWKEEIYNKLAEYENTGLEPSEIEKLKHDLAVRDRALELALISRKEILEKQNYFTCSVEKAKIEFLEQARKELEE